MRSRSTSSMALLTQLVSESKTIGIVDVAHAFSNDSIMVDDTNPSDDVVASSISLVSPSAAARRTMSDVSWHAALRMATSCSLIEQAIRCSSPTEIPTMSASTKALHAVRRTVALSSEIDLSRSISSKSYKWSDSTSRNEALVVDLSESDDTI